MVAGALALATIYVLVCKNFRIALPCWFYELTGLYCPGCGVTRMLLAMLEGQFYQAFRYNPLVFMLIPGMLLLLGAMLYKKSQGQPMRDTLHKIPEWIWIALVVVLVIYGILRNLPCCSFLAPMTIS